MYTYKSTSTCNICYAVTVIEKKKMQIESQLNLRHVDCFMLLYATLILFTKLTLHGIKVLEEFSGKRLLDKGN